MFVARAAARHERITKLFSDSFGWIQISRLRSSVSCSNYSPSESDHKINLIAALKVCCSSRDIHKGRLLHSEAVQTGINSNIYVACTLVNMYAKCGSMSEAREVFDRMPLPNVVAWNNLILGYLENGEDALALELFQGMTCSPDGRTFVAALKACTNLAVKEPWKQVNGRLLKQDSLEKGMALQSQAGSCKDIYVASTLVSMYARCGNLENARAVFQMMPAHNVVAWNALIQGYADNGVAEEALQLLASMQRTGASPNGHTYVAALKACTSLAAQEEETKINGKRLKLVSLETCMAVHSEATRNGWELDTFVGSALVGVYAKLGSMVAAQRIFDRMPHRDIISWHAIMQGYVENGQGRQALEIYFKIMATGECGPPNARILVTALKACAALVAPTEEEASTKLAKIECLGICKGLHAQAAGFGLEWDKFVASSVMDLYAKCGNLQEAQKVFDGMFNRDVVVWTSLMLGYAENCQSETALELFQLMQAQGCAPDALAFVAALKACANLAVKEEGIRLERKMVKIKALRKATALESQAMKLNFLTEMIVANTLVDLYAKCGSLLDARRIFENMAAHSVVSWTALILGYSENGEGELALETFDRMEAEGCSPNARTFVAALKACTSLAGKEEGITNDQGKLLKTVSLIRGTKIHNRAVKSGFEANKFVANTLLDMYAKCGDVESARLLFERMPQRDEISWTVILLGYADTGEMDLVLELFTRMQDESGAAEAPAGLAYVAALKACTGLAAKEEATLVDGKPAKLESLSKGMAIHSHAVSSGSDAQTFVINSLVDMYTKCGSILDARRVFDKTMAAHTVVTWNSLMLGYVEAGEADIALELFACMKTRGYLPDARSFTVAFKACGSMVALEAGKAIHGEMNRGGVDHDHDQFLEASVVDFYGRSGSMVDCRLFFDSHAAAQRDPVTWASLVSGYSRQGDIRNVLDMFSGMQREGLNPDGVVFVSLLSACGHAGLVEQGKRYFDQMQSKYGLVPAVEHYVCMVDLLGRANRLESAVEMLKDMPFEAASEVVAWTAVLSACRKWKNVEVAKVAFEKLVKIDEKSGGAYVLMANMYVDCEDLQLPSLNETDSRALPENAGPL